MNDHPFDRELYQQFDGPGKIAVAEYLLSLGRVVTVAPENFRYDIVETTPDGCLYHEVEVRSKWYGHPWRFPDISIPIRKQRQIERLRPLILWCVSPGLDEAYFVRAEDVVARATVQERWSAGKTHTYLAVPVDVWSYVMFRGSNQIHEPYERDSSISTCVS